MNKFQQHTNFLDNFFEKNDYFNLKQEDADSYLSNYIGLLSCLFFDLTTLKQNHNLDIQVSLINYLDINEIFSNIVLKNNQNYNNKNLNFSEISEMSIEDFKNHLKINDTKSNDTILNTKLDELLGKITTILQYPSLGETNLVINTDGIDGNISPKIIIEKKIKIKP